MMPTTHASLTTFVIASFVLAITPGPGVLYIVTRTLSQGRRTGLASVGGVAIGNLLNALGAALGLAALFAFSSFAFTFVKWSGAGYLIVLGIQTLRRARVRTDVALVARGSSPLAFRDGIVVATFNPKTALFFAAFLPQFIDARAAPLPQTLMLGALFVAIAAATDTAYVLCAATLRSLATARGSAFSTWGSYLSGSLYIGLGVLMATTSATSRPTN